MAKKKVTPKKPSPRATAPHPPMVPQMTGPLGQPQGGMHPLVQALIQHALQQRVSPMQGMGRPEPAAPSSPTGSAPGQIEQEALKRVLIQRMIQQQRQQQQGPV